MSKYDQIIPKYDSIAEVQAALEDHFLSSGTSFCAYFNKGGLGNVEPKPEKKYRVYWSYQDSEYIPYIILGLKSLECQHGVDRKKKVKAALEISMIGNQNEDHSSNKKSRVLKQKTKKFDCPVKITIREILQFPSHKVMGGIIGSQNQRRIVAASILKSISQSEGIKKYAIEFPSEGSHQNHPVGLTEVKGDVFRRRKKRNAAASILKSALHSEEINKKHKVKFRGEYSHQNHQTSLSETAGKDFDHTIEASKSREILRELIDMTYLIDNPDVLRELRQSLTVFKDRIYMNIPNVTQAIEDDDEYIIVYLPDS